MSVEYIEIDFREIEEKNLQEERKANGRFAAIVVAGMIIILAIYHAWIRRIAVLAGILVPALIMILYGIWVVFLTKRYKQRRLLMARQLEEVARQEYAALRLSKINKINLKQSSNENSRQCYLNDKSNNLKNNVNSNSASAEDSVKSKRHMQKNKRKKIRRSRPTAHTISTNKTGENLSNRKLSFRLKLLKLNNCKTNFTSNNKKKNLSYNLFRANSAPC